MSRLVPLAAAVLAAAARDRVRHRRAPDARRGRRRRPATRPSTPCSAASTPPGMATFTADYDVLTRFGDLHTPATVVQAAADRRSITIGNVRFIFDGPIDGDVPARHRRVQRHDRRRADQQHPAGAGLLRHERRGPPPPRRRGPRRRRRRVRRRRSPARRRRACRSRCPAASTIYCALDDGVLARLDAADVVIELTAYAPEPDERRSPATRPDALIRVFGRGVPPRGSRSKPSDVRRRRGRGRRR